MRWAFYPDDIGEAPAAQAMADLIRLDREAARVTLLKKASGSDLRERMSSSRKYPECPIRAVRSNSDPEPLPQATNYASTITADVPS